MSQMVTDTFRPRKKKQLKNPHPVGTERNTKVWKYPREGGQKLNNYERIQVSGQEYSS